MRDFTPEEKELIINTPITEDCFEIRERITFADFDFWSFFIMHLRMLQRTYKETYDKRYFTELISLLPNSYKVVKL